MKIILLIILGLFTLVSQSQEKKSIYLDENYETISFNAFSKKLESKLFIVTNVENDTAVIQKLRFINYFGDLGSKKKSQLNKLFHKRFQVDSTKVWLIYYQDTLRNVKKSKRTSLKPPKHKNKFIIVDEFRNVAPLELEKYKKLKNISLLFFYEGIKGNPLIKQHIRWYKDYNSILKRTFTDGMKMYKYIIVHPNGNFNLSSSVKSFSENRILLELKSFNEMEENWIRSHEKFN